MKKNSSKNSSKNWSKKERKQVKQILEEKSLEEDDLVETIIEELQAKGYVQRSKIAVKQQVRNCKAWTVDLESTEEESDSSLGSPQALRHSQACYNDSPRLSTLTMNTGDCLNEDEFNQALVHIDQVAATRRERLTTLKRRCDATQVSIRNVKSKIDELQKELQKMEQDAAREFAEYRKAVSEAIAIDS